MMYFSVERHLKIQWYAHEYNLDLNVLFSYILWSGIRVAFDNLDDFGQDVTRIIIEYHTNYFYWTGYNYVLCNN